MALLFMDGFDTGSTNGKWMQYNYAPVFATTTRFGVGKCIDANIYKNMGFFRTIPSVSAIYLGFAIYFPSASSVSPGDPLLYIYGDAGSTTHTHCLTSAVQAL